MAYILLGIFFNAAQLIWYSNQGEGRAKLITVILFINAVLLIPSLIYPFSHYGINGFAFVGWFILGNFIHHPYSTPNRESYLP